MMTEQMKAQTEVPNSQQPPYTRPTNVPSSRSDEIDLRELWSVIWRGKWVVIAVTFIFALASVLYAISQPNIYTSEALLAPAEESSRAGLAGLAGQFGGLASLAGVNVGGGSDKTTLAIEVLKSREFVSKFITKHNLLVPIMASKDWSLSDRILILDPDLYDASEKKWVRFEGDLGPSMQEAYFVFNKNLKVSRDKTSGFVTISFEFYSPEITKQWVDWLIADVNFEIKYRDMSEAQKSIQYLTDQLEKTPIADMQKIFYELIEEQTKKIMIAEVRDEYVFKTIDGAIVPEFKSGPNRLLMFVLGAVLGGVFSVLIVFVRYCLYERKDVEGL